EGHAVAAVRLEGQWLMLDNQRMAVVEDMNVKHYRPLFVIDDFGIMRYSDAPLVAKLQDCDPTALALSVPAPPPCLLAASDWAPARRSPPWVENFVSQARREKLVCDGVFRQALKHADHFSVLRCGPFRSRTCARASLARSRSIDH